MIINENDRNHVYDKMSNMIDNMIDKLCNEMLESFLPFTDEDIFWTLTVPIHLNTKLNGYIQFENIVKSYGDSFIEKTFIPYINQFILTLEAFGNTIIVDGISTDEVNSKFKKFIKNLFQYVLYDICFEVVENITKRELAAITIQRACHNLLYKPPYGLMIKRCMRECCTTNSIEKFFTSIN